MGPLLTNGGAITAKYRAQLHQLDSDSKKWSVTYGLSTAAINDGLSTNIKRGYTAAQTTPAMPAVLNAAKASGEHFNDVNTVSNSVLEQFGLKTTSTTGLLKNTSRVTDALTYIALATAAGFQDMGEAILYVGPSATAAGISLTTTAAAIGINSNKGITGSVAGTDLRGALTRLLLPSKQKLTGFSTTPISVAHFKKDSLTLPEILHKIKLNTKGWTDQQRASAVALAFGTTAQAGLLAYISAGGGQLRKYTSTAQTASDSTAKIANQLNNTDAAKLHRFQESITVLDFTVGQKLLPTHTPLIKTATDVVNAFSKMDSGTQQTLIKFAAFAAVVGPDSSLIGGALKPVVAYSKDLSHFAGVLGRDSAAAKIGGTAMDVLKSGFSKTAFTALLVAPAAAAVADGASHLGAALGGAAASDSGLLADLGPIVPVVTPDTAVVGAGVALWTLWGKKALQSAHNSSRWGTHIGADADRSASKILDASGTISGALQHTNHTVTQLAKTISKGFKHLTLAAKTAAHQSQTAAKLLAKSLGGTAADKLTKQAAKTKAANAKHFKENTSNNKKAQALTHSFNKSGAQNTAHQYQLLDNYRRKNAALAVKTLQISGSQQLNVLKAVLGQNSHLSKSAALEQYQDMTLAANKTNRHYKSQQAKINTTFKLHATLRHVALTGLTRDHQLKIHSLYAGAIQALLAQDSSRSTMLATLQTHFTHTDSQAESAILSYTNAMALGVKSNRDFAAATTGFGKAAQQAGHHTLNLVLHTKTD